jgi:hypothetical protein
LPDDDQSQWDYLDPNITTEYFKSLRAARERLNHQIAMSRKTLAATQEYLRKLDEMLEKSVLKP